jgi:hypothetical protein
MTPNRSSCFQKPLRENLSAKDIRNDYICWLEWYWWRWIGVLTFREGIRVRRARQLLLDWISAIQTDERHAISYFAVREIGGESEHLHYHVLVAGVASRLERYLHLWEESAGYAKLSPFRSNFVRLTPEGLRQSSGISYALKSLQHDECDFEFDLHDEHLLPRFRRPDDRSQSVPLLRSYPERRFR